MTKIRDFISGVFGGFCREFKLVLHDSGIILFITILPFIYPLVYSLIYNPELAKDVSMVVVDNDRTQLSRELVRNLDACDKVWVRGYAANLGEAKHAMDSHKCYAILEIPEGFERKAGRMETAPAVMYCDMTLLLRYRGFLIAATDVMQAMGSELMTQDINRMVPLAGTIATGDLLPIENVSMGNIRNGFDSFIMPGVLILILQQCIILTVGMAGGARREKPSPIGLSMYANRKSLFGAMTGKTLCYMFLFIVPAIFIAYCVPMIFKFPMAGDILEIFALIVPLMLGSIGIGFVFQAFVSERESVFVSWVVTSLVFLMLSGLVWPRYDMPPVWRVLSEVFPGSWAIEGFVKMNSNGAALWQVRNDYLMLWAVALGWNVLGYCVQRWAVLPSIYRKKNNETVGKSAI